MSNRTDIIADFEWLLRSGERADVAARRCGYQLATIRKWYKDSHRPLPRGLGRPAPIHQEPHRGRRIDARHSGYRKWGGM